MTKRGKRFHFTYNNYTDESIGLLKKIPGCSYCFVGEETGDTGTPHLQGYLEFGKRVTITALQKRLKKLGIKMHLEVAKGTRAQNEEYCCKEGKWQEWGEPMMAGKRTDLIKLSEECKTKTVDQVLVDNPCMAFKYAANISKVVSAHTALKHKAELKESFAHCTMREWQLDAMERIRLQDNRKVLWYVDYAGGQGKTFLGKWLASRGCFLVRSGKTQDISFAFNYEKVVVFDYTREREEYMNYSIIEAMKDGVIFSPKYQSKTKVWSGSKVVCFSNFYPDTAKMSSDRWDIIELDERIKIR